MAISNARAVGSIAEAASKQRTCAEHGRSMKRQWCVYWEAGIYEVGIWGVARSGFGWLGYGPYTHNEAHRMVRRLTATL